MFLRCVVVVGGGRTRLDLWEKAYSSLWRIVERFERVDVR